MTSDTYSDIGAAGLAATGLALAAGAATCVAQSNVYSLNVVGYVNKSLPAGLTLIATLSRRLRHTITRLEDMAFHDATHRVMRVVLNVATAGLETRGTPIIQGMTHYDIATLAGTSRETASRVISQLAREGIITNKGRRILVDLSKLSERLERD